MAIRPSEFKLLQFVKMVETAAGMLRTQNLTLVAIAFVFVLLSESIEKRGAIAANERGELHKLLEDWGIKQP